MRLFRTGGKDRDDPPTNGDGLGEALVAEGVVGPEGLRAALDRRRGPKDADLADALVSSGHADPEAVARVVARRANAPYVDLAAVEVDSAVVAVAREDVFLRYRAAPVGSEDGRLVVAVADPGDKEARSELAVSAGHPVSVVVASSTGIEGLQRRLFGRSTGDAPGPSGTARTANGGGRTGRRRGGRIGDILVSEGRITEAQLREALELQKVDGRDLGEILVSLGYVVPTDLARALARRFKLDYVVLSDLKEGEFDPAVLDPFDEETLRKYGVLPLRREGNATVVAMADPNDLFALEDLQVRARGPIQPVVATQEDVCGALDHLFGDAESGADGDANEERPEEPELQEIPEPVAVIEELDAAAEPVAEPVAEPEAGRSRRVGIGAARIGDILVADGVVTEGQLAEALDRQERDGREIGKILVSLGYVSLHDLARALAKRLRLEYVELTERDVDRGVALLVDQKVQRRYGLVPLRMEGNRLVVAMSDPTNVYALEDLAMISGLPVTPVVAAEDEIRQVHAKLFALSEEVSEFLEEAGRETTEGDLGELALGEHNPDEAPIIRLVSSILQQAVGDGASDVHIEPRARELVVRMRVDGVLREVMSIPPKLQSGVIARLKIVANLDIAERRVPQDGRFSVRLGGQKLDLRVASLPTVHGEKVVLRLLDTSNATVDLTKLGFAPEVYERYEEIFRRPYGTILVTGPTGSGKSTTLYATLNELNTPERNIITVEDPVEYRMSGINQIQTNPKAGLTFASALRSILRADPDVLMVGEIRDRETAKIAVEAALTGHLVLATLHTNNAPGALNRLTDMGVEPFLTASAVDCVIAQRLARRLCEHCKEPVEVDASALTDLGFSLDLLPERVDFHRAVGCDRCGGSGYRGRLGIYEMMVVSGAIKEMILSRASAGEVARAAEEEGMVRLRDDGLLKAARGVTTIEEILRTVV